MNVKKDDRTCFAYVNEKIVEIDLWHKRISHVNLQKLKSMQLNELVFGLPHFKNKEMHYVCETCQFGKNSRSPFKKERFMSSHVLQLVHVDVWGPSKEPSHGGSKYYVTFIDDYSRKV